MNKRIIRLTVTAVLLAFSVLSAHAQQTVAPPRFAVTVLTDRPSALYHVGEKATFNIGVKDGSQPVQDKSVTYALSLDGVGDLGRGKLDLKDGKASASGSLDKPGILRCTVVFAPDPKDRAVALAGAAFDPEKIEPTAVMPSDFDEFWKVQKAALAKIPMDAQLVPVKQPNDKIEVFQITLANVNKSRVHGVFARPKGPGPFPAILTVPGAGVRVIGPGEVTGHAASGFLAMSISVHDIPNDRPPDFYPKLKDGELKDYRARGREDRMTYYFYRVFLGCVRSVDYLTSLPKWDRKHMIVNGSSQGGALSLVTAGLDPRITALAANVPAMCDHSGRDFGRPSGWPQLAPMGKDGKLDPKVLAVSAYYDAVNFAKKFNGPAIVGVGLIDNVCPATTVYAAYNVLRGPKRMDIAPLMGHAQSKSYIALKERWILERAGLKK